MAVQTNCRRVLISLFEKDISGELSSKFPPRLASYCQTSELCPPLVLLHLRSGREFQWFVSMEMVFRRRCWTKSMAESTTVSRELRLRGREGFWNPNASPTWRRQLSTRHSHGVGASDNAPGLARLRHVCFQEEKKSTSPDMMRLSFSTFWTLSLSFI